MITRTARSAALTNAGFTRATLAAAMVALTACSSNPAARVETRPVPMPPPGARGPSPASLPAIPVVDGTLAIDVVYPREGVTMAARDSTFIFGNVGTGRADLRINSAPVTVEPNGAFLAFLPVPLDGVYRVEATRDGQTVRAERRVNVPLAETPRSGVRATILASSLAPRGALAVRRDELLDVVFRGTAGGQAAIVLPSGRRVNLVEEHREGSTISTYRAAISPEPFMTRDTTVRRPRVGSSEIELENQVAYFELLIGTDTVRVPVPANLTVIDPMRPAVGVAADPNPVGGSNDGYVVGRPAPGTVSHYFWPNGTELTIVGERAGEYRVQLNDELTAWVSADEVRLLPEGTPIPTSLVNNVSIVVDTGWVDVRLPISRRLPFTVEEGDHELTVTLYGATSASDWLIFGARNSVIETASWQQPRDGVYQLKLRLVKPLWGYQTFFNERGQLIVRVRKPPGIDSAANPLRGRLIALDPGHGAIEGRWGPTRVTEAQANLDIALKLRDLLQQAGARVLMTRVDSTAVGLYDRPVMATRENADLFVSIHNNAVGDGVNPYTNHGTSTYFFHTSGAELSRMLQNELVSEFGLPDLGYVRASLAVVRWPTWMPATLTESFFFIIPEQEAALRDPAVIERIARAHVRGIEAFLKQQGSR